MAGGARIHRSQCRRAVLAIADGESGGPGDAQTYLLLANTSPISGDVLVTVYLEGGGSVRGVVPMHASSRVPINVGEFPFVNQRRFAATALALGNSPISLVVERATYWTAGGVFWGAGTDAVARRCMDAWSAATLQP